MSKSIVVHTGRSPTDQLVEEMEALDVPDVQVYKRGPCRTPAEVLEAARTCKVIASFGAGTDNIDIVLNELDALVNVDLATRTVRREHRSLRIVRMGTTGALQPGIAPGDLVVSAFGLGLDKSQIGQFTAMVQALYKLFVESDASLVEVNPLIVDGAGDLVALAKLVSGLDRYDAQSTALVSSDVPEAISDSYRLFLGLLHNSFQ